MEQGLLTGKFHDNPQLIKTRVGWRKYLPLYRPSGLERTKPVIDTLKKIAKQHDATPSQVALNWLINFHGERVVAIPGATRIEQAQQNLGTFNFNLTESEMVRLIKFPVHLFDTLEPYFLEEPINIRIVITKRIEIKSENHVCTLFTVQEQPLCN